MMDIGILARFTVKALHNPLARFLLILVLTLLPLKLISVFPQNSINTYPILGGCEVASQKRLHQTKCAGENKQSLYSDFFVPDESAIRFSYRGNGNYWHVRIENQQQLIWQAKLVKADKYFKVFEYAIPEKNRDIPIRIVIKNAKPNGWLAVTSIESINFGFATLINYSVMLLTLCLFHIVLLLLYHFCKRVLPSLPAALSFPVVFGLIGYLSVIAYWGHVHLGSFVSFLFALLIIHELYSLSQQTSLSSLASSHRDFLPITAFTLLVITIGFFPYSQGVIGWYSVAADRWSELTIDNWIPKLFADRLWLNEREKPFLLGWLTSDRPPLQTGLNLIFYPLTRAGESYQVLSMWLQASVLLPTIFLLKQIEKSQICVFLTIVGLSFSSLFMQHTIFVWPKLVSACYLIIIYVVLMTKFRMQMSTYQRVLLASAATALAMLSHGGAIFGLIPIYLLAAIRHHNSLRSMILTGLVSIAIYLPWVCYQKLIDPPGNRMVKWHLAGMPQINDLSIVEALKHSYMNISFTDWWVNRMSNIDVITDYMWRPLAWLKYLNTTPSVTVIDGFHGLSFTHFFFSFWFLSPIFAIILFLLLGWVGRYRVHSDMIWLFLTSLTGLVIWVLLLFSPGRTFIHHGTFFTWIICFILSAQLLSNTHKAFLFVAVLLNVFISIQFYAFDLLHSGLATDTLYQPLFYISASIFLISVWYVSHYARYGTLKNISG